ncbi:MAG: RNA degradosome polyphosphate kinase, partial [Gammaproteobacteria bacterium]|nr:RNA degradosome polyphosphate kinase [Gammaproteobacteria bacterium]
ADWMDRNLFRRVETCFPILKPKLKRRILNELNDQLRDNVGAWKLCSNGQYKKLIDKQKRFSAQEKLLKKWAAWR